jgi:peptide/nickel transport system permease protein
MITEELRQEVLPEQVDVPPRPRLRRMKRFLRHRAGTAGLVVLVIIVTAVALAPWIAPYDPNAQDLGNVLQSPSPEHWLGTDDLGRDVFSRLLYGGRISLLAAGQAVAIAVVLGVLPGLLAGFRGGRLEAVVMRGADALMAFPPIILAIAIIAAVGPGLTNAMVALGIIFAPRFVRVARAAAASARHETYIEAARSVGLSDVHILIRHIVPNSLSPLIVQVSLTLGVAMLSEAGLSFLGLAVQPPEASWGAMLGRSFRYFNVEPLLLVWPGLAITITVLCLNLVGDALRDALGRERRPAR